MSGAVDGVTPTLTPSPTHGAHNETLDGRERLVGVLRARGDGGASGAAAPGDVSASGLPALIADLPGDDSRAPQTQFTLDLRIAFLESLAVTGSVRSAAKRTRVSHQTVYRARRSSAAFGRAWDAALVVARAQAEARLADCAMEGYEEEVWYHGEMVGTRTRFSQRLLLAHLGRLDRIRSDDRIDALAEDFDAMIARMRAGDAIDVAPESASHGVNIPSPGQCNRRSMSRETEGGETDGGETGGGETDGGETGDGGPAAANDSCGDGPDCMPIERLLTAMDAARPADAPVLQTLGDPAEVESCQMEAFAVGDPRWWRYGARFTAFVRDADGEWVADTAQDPSVAAE